MMAQPNNTAPKRGRPSKPNVTETMSNEQIGTEYAKKTKMKPRGGNSPIIGDNGIYTEPGDVARILGALMEVLQLPIIDQSDSGETRVIEYFKICAKWEIKPGVAGLALAFSTTRQTLLRWENGENLAECSPGRRVTIKKAKMFLNAYLEELGQSNKIHPGAFAFLCKNHFGYRDTTDIVVSPSATLGETESPDVIQAKMVDALPESD